MKTYENIFANVNLETSKPLQENDRRHSKQNEVNKFFTLGYKDDPDFRKAQGLLENDPAVEPAKKRRVGKNPPEPEEAPAAKKRGRKPKGDDEDETAASKPAKREQKKN